MRNNKGFSLVELLVAFAIAAIAGLAVFALMTTGVNNFRRASNDIGLQYEQQIAINSIKDIILETSNAIVYTGPEFDGIIDGSDPVVPEGEATPTPESTPGVTPEPTPEAGAASGGESTLTVFNTLVDEVTGDKKIEIIALEFRKDNEDDETGTVYRKSKVFNATITDPTDPTKVIVNPDIVPTLSDTDNKGVIAENVKSFTLDLSKASKDLVYLSMKFYKDEREYSVTETIALRNRITVADSVGAVKIDEVFDDVISEQINSFIVAIEISRNGKVIPAGDTDTIGLMDNKSIAVKYDAHVRVLEGSERNYVVGWSIGDTAPAGVNITADGLLTIPDSINASVGLPAFEVRATCVDDPTKYAHIFVKLEDNGVYPVSIVEKDYTHVFKEGVMRVNLNHEITYTDGTKKTDGNLAKYHITSQLPEGCVQLDDVLLLNSNANDVPITVYAECLERNASNEVLRTKEYVILFTDIPEFKPGTQLKINVSDRIERGGTFNISVQWEDTKSADYSYDWKLEPINRDEVYSAYNEQKKIVEETEAKIREYQANTDLLGGIEKDYDTNYMNHGYEDLMSIIEAENNRLYTVANWNRNERTQFGECIRFGTKYNDRGLEHSTNYLNRIATAYCKSYLSWNEAFVVKVTVTATANPSSKIKENDVAYTYTSEAYGVVRPVVVNLTPMESIPGDSNSAKRISTDDELLLDDPYQCSIRRAYLYSFENLRGTARDSIANLDSPAKWYDQGYDATAASAKDPAFLPVTVYRMNMFYDANNIKFYEFGHNTDKTVILYDFNISKFFPKSYWPDQIRIRPQIRDGKGNYATSPNTFKYKVNMNKVHPDSQYTLQRIKDVYKGQKY